MRPQDQTNSPSKAPSRDINVPARDAAVNVVRGQIDDLYNNKSGSDVVDTPNQQPAIAQKQQPVASTASDPWQQYHSAWQDYYQQYYERYYAGHVQKILSNQSPQQNASDTSAERPVETPKNAKESV